MNMLSEKEDKETEAVEKQEMFLYLDSLRESGVTNMYGAGVYLVDEFGLNRDTARDVVLEWMRTFSKRHGLKEI